MATNLFETFDAAFAAPRRSLSAELAASAARAITEMMQRRRRAAETRQVMEMAPYLQKDIGIIASGGTVWPISSVAMGHAEWR